MRELAPDISIVVAYGHILPREIIDLPRLGTLNIHASLLPEYRGAAPIQAAIRDGVAETGVTIMQMVPALDAGPVILALRTPVEPDETAGELQLRLAELGAEALIEALVLLSGRQGHRNAPERRAGDLCAQDRARGRPAAVRRPQRPRGAAGARLRPQAGRLGARSEGLEVRCFGAQGRAGASRARRVKCWSAGPTGCSSPAARARCESPRCIPRGRNGSRPRSGCAAAA